MTTESFKKAEELFQNLEKVRSFMSKLRGDTRLTLADSESSSKLDTNDYAFRVELVTMLVRLKARYVSDLSALGVEVEVEDD